jgi:hypothetical protein
MSRDTAIRIQVTKAEVEGTQLRPLTERIVFRLPGPRLLWVVVWLSVPWVNAAVILWLQAAGHLPPWDNVTVELLSRAAFSFAILGSVWGAAKIVHGLTSLESSPAEFLGEIGGLTESFRGMGSTAAPLLFSIGTMVIFGGQSVVVHDSWVRGIVMGSAWLVIGIALWSFIWVYLNLQLGLHRLGRRRLDLRPNLGDRSLGLRPLGKLAFTGFWAFVAVLAPLVVATVSNRLGLLVGLLVLLAGVAAFFLSLRRLNRQMAAAKHKEIAWARHLYAQAFEPVRKEGTLEALQDHSGPLGAAEALEKRAERIQEWPFDEATFARVVTISSTVVAAILARVLLAPFDI